MQYSPRNIRIACEHGGLTHFGGAFFFHEFIRVLQLRRFLARHLYYPRRNNHYRLSQMILALVYPIVLGLDRIETSSFLRANGTFQYLTGLPSFPDPQTLRRFLLHAPAGFWEQLHRVNDRLLHHFIHQPERRSRLIFDLDSTVVTVFGHQDGAEVGYNPRYRGKRSYDPLLCMEANSSFLWDSELRPGNAGTWAGSVELLDTCFANVPPEIRELRVRADAGFGYDPIFDGLEGLGAEYAIVARLTPGFRSLLPGLRYEEVNREWEMADCEHRSHGWTKNRRFVITTIPGAAGNATDSFFRRPLCLSRLGHQSVAHSCGHLALLRWPCRPGATHPRIAGGLRPAEGANPSLCSQRPVFGNHSLGLQLGDRFPTDVSA